MTKVVYKLCYVISDPRLQARPRRRTFHCWVCRQPPSIQTDIENFIVCNSNHTNDAAIAIVVKVGDVGLSPCFGFGPLLAYNQSPYHSNLGPVLAR